MNKVNNLLTKFGVALLPLVEGAMDSLIPLIEKGAAELSEKMGPAIQDISTWIQTQAIPAFQQLVGLFQDNVMPIVRDVVEVVGVLGEAFDQMVKGNFAGAAEWLDTGGPVGTALANFVESLENLKPTFETVSAYVTGTLVPAFKAVSAWITETGVPAVQNLVLWLKENIPPAMEAVSAFITGTLVPAFKAVSAWITETGVPAVQNFVLWLQENVPPAMAAVSAFITDTLVPAFEKVSAWITETGVPAVQNLIAWLQVNVPVAFEAVKAAIQTVITFVTDNWSTIQTLLMQPVENAWDAIETAFEIGKTLIAGIQAAITGDWDTTWEKAEAVFDLFFGYFERTIGRLSTVAESAFTLLDTATGGALTAIADSVSETLQPAIDWINEFMVPAMAAIGVAIQAAWEIFLPFVTTAVNNVIAFVTENWSEIETLLKTPVETAIAAIETLLEVGGLAIEAILLAIQGDWTGVWEKVEGILDAFLEFFKTSLGNLLTAATTGFGLIDTAAGGAFSVPSRPSRWE